MKQLFWVAGFILLVFIGDRLGAYLLGQMTEKSQFRYSRMYTGNAAAEVLFLGNSRGLAFYQPYIEAQTGLSTLNLSYNGLPVDLASALIRDYYDRYPAPGKVVIDVSLCDRFDNRLLMNFSPYLPFSDRIGELIEQANPKVRAGLSLSHLFRYNSELFQRALYYRKRSDVDWVVERELSASKAGAIAEDYEFIIRYPSAAPGILGDLVRFCESRGSQVELLIGPYFPPFREKIINLDDFLREIEAATGQPVKNYSDMLQDLKYFADFQHLNQLGSQAFCDSLIRSGLLAQ